jgi:energy-coupling factor transporter ATP-binding protein EcfA2
MTEESVQINTLEIENVMRIKAVKIECNGKALTVIGGRNGQGKTTALQAIAYALGGERFRPSNFKRDGALAHPEIKITLSNGWIVERRGKNAALKVTDPEGKGGGQQLLNQVIHLLALDLPRFLQAKPAEKAEILLQIIGVGDELKALEDKEQKTYNERHALGQIADQKRKYADELVTYPDAPDKIVTATGLIQEQQQILAKNGENQRLRNRVEELTKEYLSATKEHERLIKERDETIARLEKECDKAFQEKGNIAIDLNKATKTAEQLQDESTKEIEASLNEIDATNVQVRANMDKEKANEEAEEYGSKYAEMTIALDGIRAEKKALLDGADLPLPGLSVEAGELTYNGKAWDCMAGSDQYRVATAIVRRLNPKCGFVLIDRIEALDLPTLQEFGLYLEKEGLQVISTRVSKGPECSIIIEDGFSVEAGQKTFVKGEF